MLISPGQFHRPSGVHLCVTLQPHPAPGVKERFAEDLQANVGMAPGYGMAAAIQPIE